MFKKPLIITILTLSILFQGCSDEATQKQEANAVLADPEYVLTSTDGTSYTVKEKDGGFIIDGMEGKVILFDIFATWCPPCKASATHLTSLQNKFKDDLIIIGITIEDEISNAKLERFKDDYNAQYVLVNSKVNRPLINEIVNTLDLGQRFPIPIMAIFKDGKLINHYIGEVQEEFVESDIKVALGK